MIYLDNAATSFPKPYCVYEAVNRCIRTYCGNPGRGSHPMALAASEKIYECREYLCDYFHADAPSQVVFTLNATYALNYALKGLLSQGDHVLISNMEHNAVRRPLERMAQDGLIEYSQFSTMLESEESRARRTPTRICARIASALRPNTRAVVCSHQSNLCSATLPLTEIGAFCHRHRLLLIVDASQSAGHLPIDMQKMRIDALCAPGHKGLYGIQGCGFVIFRQGLLPDSLIEGGSGYASLEPTMPDDLPERGEAGTLPTPAIAGLCAGVRYLSNHAAFDIHSYEKRLYCALRERLEHLKDIRIYLPEYEGSTLLFSHGRFPADHLGQLLAHRGICVRTGYHCAALGHQTLKTPDGGAVRVSFGAFNRLREIDTLYAALCEL